MKQEKIDRIERGLTTVARKVYRCVPKLHEWDSPKIMGEMVRAGFHINLRTLMGCLQSLKKSGLIKEPQRGMFIALTASEPTNISVTKEMTEFQPEDNKPAKIVPFNPDVEVQDMPEERPQRDPMDILSDLTEKMDELRLEFDNAAIEISEYVQQAEQDVQKMRQLQSLLKSIGD